MISSGKLYAANQIYKEIADQSPIWTSYAGSFSANISASLSEPGLFAARKLVRYQHCGHTEEGGECSENPNRPKDPHHETREEIIFHIKEYFTSMFIFSIFFHTIRFFYFLFRNGEKRSFEAFTKIHKSYLVSVL